MKNYFCRTLLTTAAWLAFLGTAPAESLQDAVSEAIGTHPSVKAAMASHDASTQTVREQRSAYYPELSVSTQAGRIYGDNATSRGLSVTRGAGYSWLWEGNAALTQKIYDWGETGNKVDAAKAREAAASMTIENQQDAIALRAAQAFISLLRASDLKNRAAVNLEAIKSYQEKIAVQVEEGGSDEAELNRANDFLLLAQNAATEFEGQYQQGLAEYIEAVGHAPEMGLKRPMLPATFPANLDSAIDQAFMAHPQVAAAKQSVIATDYDMRAEKTSYLPKVSGQLSYLERDQDDLIGGEATDARAVVKADWNYSTGGAQHARVDRAQAMREQAKAELDEVYRRVERDIRVGWAMLDTTRQQQETQENRRAATAKVVDTYKTQYEGGNRTLIELMQAESQAFDASVAYANADYGVLSATYTLMAAMGQLIPALTPTTAIAESAAHDEPAAQQ
ncbi:MAG TPA: TolC family protein [Alphaproteobacteria bacterium]